MPRLSSITDKLVTTGSKRTPIFVKTYTGTDFSSFHSTWTFSTGSIGLTSINLPYHSYGNSANTSTIQIQQIDRVWPLRAGTNQSSLTIVSVSTGSTIGYWINGVSIYSPSAGSEVPNGYLTFTHLNYDAAYDTDLYYSFSLDQDFAGGHWRNDGVYHYHNFSFANAWTTGTGHVSGGQGTTGTAEVSLIHYLSTSSTGLVHDNGHSKILGWSLDGYPIYGPYGFNQPLDFNSGIRPMVSGYMLYDNINLSPLRLADGATNLIQYPFGMFIQDYYFAGTGDLDISNGRYCVTPEYPTGTYAYFTTISTITNRSAYPYVIGRQFKTTPSLGSNTTTNFTSGGGFAPKQTS